MGYLEAPLSLNPSDRKPKTTIVARVMLGTVLTTAAELALPPRRCGLSGARTLAYADPRIFELKRPLAQRLSRERQKPASRPDYS